MIKKFIILFFCWLSIGAYDNPHITKFGVLVHDVATTPDEISVAKSLHVGYYRMSINEDQWTGSSGKYNQLSSAGFKIFLNINWRSVAGMAQPYPVGAQLLQYADTVGKIMRSVASQHSLEVVTCENEETNTLYHTGSMTEYVAELAIATDTVHANGGKIVDGGIHPPGVNYWIWKDYLARGMTAQAAYWQNISFTTTMKNAANNPGSNPGFDYYWRQIDTLLNGFTTIPVDYVNVHIYEAINDIGNGNTATPYLINTMKNYMERRTGKPCLTNECGQQLAYNQNSTSSFLQAYINASFPYVIWYSGDGVTSYALNDTLGDPLALRQSGTAFKNYMDRYKPIILP